MLGQNKRIVICCAKVLGVGALACVSTASTWALTSSWGITAGAALALIVLYWCRKHPDAVLGTHLVLCALQLVVVDSPLPADLAVAASFYAVGRRGRRELTPVWAAAVVVGAALGAWDWNRDELGVVPLSLWAQDMAQAFVTQLCVAVATWGLGRLVTQRGQLRASRQAAHDAALRNEIAQEVHDVVGHALALIAVQAEAGHYLAAGSDDIDVPADERLEQAAQALGQIRTTVRSALADTRSLTRTLASPPQPGEPPGAADSAEPDDARAASQVTDKTLRPIPRISDLPGLIDDVRTTGLTVTLSVDDRLMSEGMQPNGINLLSAQAQLALYRTAQESLTNVLKHAEAAAVDVRLEYRADGIVLTIADYPGPSGSQTSPRAGGDRLSLADHGGVSSEAAPAGTGGGQGLVNLRQRLEAVGGTLEAGPRPGGGFVVRARVPVEPSTSVFVNPRSEAT